MKYGTKVDFSALTLLATTWSLMNRFRTGQGPRRANLHKWVSHNHLPVIVASDRPRTTLSTRAR